MGETPLCVNQKACYGDIEGEIQILPTVAESGMNSPWIYKDFLGKEIKNEKHFYAFYSRECSSKRKKNTITSWITITSLYFWCKFSPDKPIPSSVCNAQIYRYLVSISLRFSKLQGPDPTFSWHENPTHIQNLLGIKANTALIVKTAQFMHCKNISGYLDQA